MDCVAKQRDFSDWKGIVRSFNHVTSGYGWSESISFWFDTWILNDLLSLLIDKIHYFELTWTVANINVNRQ